MSKRNLIIIEALKIAIQAWEHEARAHSTFVSQREYVKELNAKIEAAERLLVKP